MLEKNHTRLAAPIQQQSKIHPPTHTHTPIHTYYTCTQAKNVLQRATDVLCRSKAAAAQLKGESERDRSSLTQSLGENSKFATAGRADRGRSVAAPERDRLAILGRTGIPAGWRTV